MKWKRKWKIETIKMRRSERDKNGSSNEIKTTHKYQKETNSYLFIHDRLKRRKSYGKIISKKALQEKLFKKRQTNTTNDEWRKKQQQTRERQREKERERKGNENKTKLFRLRNGSCNEWLKKRNSYIGDDGKINFYVIRKGNKSVYNKE